MSPIGLLQVSGIAMTWMPAKCALDHPLLIKGRIEKAHVVGNGA
jgi:hypothetical protein